ncbi:hypothetical protein PanWU01x14_268610 [Parasponia andersonii]|uniref:Uncharacterized protein n=1 Tax=Parasponia andersonii TaxID=3476 RepID=A0A2P5B5Y9_PARAD|nr:hypothetical protein PanWU01x14_268610 [Parasponia andersonii]
MGGHLSLAQLQGLGGQRCVMPKQTCPRPNCFGHNLHSKTLSFMGFYNSYQVLHFAMLFIDWRAEVSIAESHFDILKNMKIERGASSPSLCMSMLIPFFSLVQITLRFIRPARMAPDE